MTLSDLPLDMRWQWSHLHCNAYAYETTHKPRLRINGSQQPLVCRLQTASFRPERSLYLLQSTGRAWCLIEQDNRCFYCGDEFGTLRRLNGQMKLVKLHWDHVVPFVFNANNHEFVAACSTCNHAKSAMIFADLDEAKRVLQLKMYERKKATA